MICPLCNAFLEDFDDTIYCSNCGHYIKAHITYQSETNDRYNYNLTKPNPKNTKKKDYSEFFLVFMMIILPIILHLFL